MAYMHLQTRTTFTLKTVVTIFMVALSFFGVAEVANPVIAFTPVEQVSAPLEY